MAQELGDRLELDEWHRIIETSADLPAPLRRAAHKRLNNLGRLVGPSDGPGMWDMVVPNELTIFHMGGPHMGHRTATTLGSTSPRHIIGVEAVDLVDQDDAVKGAVHGARQDHGVERAFTKVARMVRHQSSTLGLFGQDLLRVPDELFGPAGLITVMRLRNPRVYQHLRERCCALRGFPASAIEGLGVAEAVMATTASTDPDWREAAQRVFLRPPLCAPGGDTRAEA